MILINYHNFLKFGLLITATHFLMASGCSKDKTPRPCANGGSPYSFNVTSEFSPQREVYNVGDTIIIISKFPKILYDNITNQLIDYSNNLGLKGTAGISYIDSINHQILRWSDSFPIINVKGTTSINTTKAILTTYEESTNDFRFECKIILRKRGNYQITIEDLGCQGIIGKDCTNAGFFMKIINSNKHFNILTNALIPGIFLDQLLTDHTYCYRVQ